MDTIVNRVANSGLITLNLEDHYPSDEIVEFDLKPFLFKELILKEKDFRTALKALDWSVYRDKIFLVHCSTDAIIPAWAYMLVAAYATPEAKEVYQGNKSEYLSTYYHDVVKKLDVSAYEQKRIVIKGCSNKPVPASAYADLTAKLQPLAQSIMYGEPCSTVPIFKRPRQV